MSMHTNPATLPGDWNASRALTPSDGLYNRWIVVHPSNSSYTPFVVHVAHWDDDRNEWCYQYGDYCKTRGDAMTAFHKRVEKYLGA